MIKKFFHEFNIRKLTIAACLAAFASLSSFAAPPTNKCSEPFWSIIGQGCIFFCDTVPGLECMIETTEENCTDSVHQTQGKTASCWNEPSGGIRCRVGKANYYCYKPWQPPGFSTGFPNETAEEFEFPNQ